MDDGIPAAYQCPICQDGHFVYRRKEDGTPDYSNLVPCICIKAEFERQKMRRLLSYCELPAGSEHMTFENFKRCKGTEEAYNLALALAEEKDGAVNWLTFTGDVDRGKTHLVLAICRRWLARKKPARYAYVPLLLDELRRGFHGEGDESYDNRFQVFCNVPLLALDDLGTEHRTSWVQERLETILDYRLMNDLPLVVTTNCLMKELSFRIASRLQRGGKILLLDAPAFHSTGWKR